MPNYQDKEFMTAKEAREAAARHERLSNAARAEGDKTHSDFHAWQAAEYREIARNKEIT